MATSFASNYIASLEAQTAYRLDMAARPALEGKAKAEALYHGILAAKALGDMERARELAVELRPLLDYLK